jgi:1D-myo-inositol 3-kinase
LENKVRLLSIGHCCHDKTTDGGFVPGGTALYASMAARSLGAEPSVITSFGDDYQFNDVFLSNDIALISQIGERTTVFENIYTESGRTQYLLTKADNISRDFIVENAPVADIVLLCPICDEIDFSLPPLFSNQLVASTIQGWLRAVNPENKKVTPKIIDWSLFEGIDIIILSREDIATIPEVIESIIKYVPIVILTDGPKGAIVYENNSRTHVPVFPVVEKDATGAGDVFAVSFLLKYHETKNTIKSCIFAHAAASFIVEGMDISSLPSLAKIEARMDLLNKG